MFLLLQNHNIVPGTRWICRVDIDGGPNYVAQVREFKREIEAREFSQAEDGVLVPGRPWALKFAGVVDNTLCPIDGNFFEQRDVFMQDAAIWLSIRG